MSRSSDKKRRTDFVEIRKRSVDNLQLLYSVVVSLAVTDMLQHVLAGPSGISIPDLSARGTRTVADGGELSVHDCAVLPWGEPIS